MPPKFCRSDALAELGLVPGAKLTEDDLKRRFRQLALEHHPDKVRARGGDTLEATTRFQRISAAHEALRKELTQAPSQLQTTAADIAAAAAAALAKSRSGGRFRVNPDGQTAQVGAAKRQGASSPTFPIRSAAYGVDPASLKVPLPRSSGRRPSFTGDLQHCKFCTGAPRLCIDKPAAESLRFDWATYSAHPNGLQTCVMCKMAQRSVMTVAQALSQFSTLEGKQDAFDTLKAGKRSFVIGTVDYFWYDDLDALASGKSLVTSVHAPAAAKRTASPTDENAEPNKRRRQNEQEQEVFSFCANYLSSKKSGAQRWRYRVISDKKVGIRVAPDVNAEPSPNGHLQPGAFAEISERKQGSDGRWYFRLANGSGWTYDRSAKDHDKIVMREAFPGEREGDLSWLRDDVDGNKDKKEKKDKKDKKEAKPGNDKKDNTC